MEKTCFFKYFWNTIKESKWLLLRYFIVGVFSVVIGIISNKLHLNDLTYYNAMITLCYFGEMIAFGFIEGFGIYINQNIKDQEKARKYIKLGLYFTIFFVLCFAVLLICFPSFILKNILNLNFEVNLWFYYLMITSIVLMTIFGYVSYVLKKIGEFRLQIIITLIQTSLTIIGFLLILFFNKLMLIPIAIAYIITYIICIFFSSHILSKNQLVPVNIFKIEKLSITKQETRIVLARAMIEVVWEIGYVFVSLFILKINQIAYNQYCYFENSLDILNGIFFSFVSVVSIKIARSIGEQRIDEAKLHAKYSIISTFVIWLIFASISLLLFLPLRSGMNYDLRDSAFIPYILYLIIMLLRFLEWNLGTYILGQSEHFVKLGLIEEIFFTCYWIILYLCASIIPFNNWIIYSIIAFENLTKTIIALIVLRKNKWLKKSI